MIIGAQLYTVRESCRTTEDLAETLKKVADIGYTTVQLSGICPYDPHWMAEQLKETGLTADITHFDYNRYINETDEMIDFHDIINCKYMGTGGFGCLFSDANTAEEKVKKTMLALVPAAKKMNERGHKFMYHNHNGEFAHFSDGRTILENICDFLAPDEMGITLDTYWVQAGGADPAEWLRRLKGRVDCVHFKDMSYAIGEDNGIKMAPIGEGNMNYNEIIKACDDAEVKFAYIEQDNCNGEDPFDCLKRSYDYFKALGF